MSSESTVEKFLLEVNEMLDGTVPLERGVNQESPTLVTGHLECPDLHAQNTIKSHRKYGLFVNVAKKVILKFVKVPINYILDRQQSFNRNVASTITYLMHSMEDIKDRTVSWEERDVLIKRLDDRLRELETVYHETEFRSQSEHPDGFNTQAISRNTQIIDKMLKELFGIDSTSDIGDSRLYLANEQFGPIFQLVGQLVDHLRALGMYPQEVEKIGGNVFVDNSLRSETVLETVERCFICGGTNFRTIGVKDGLTINECTICDLGIVSPRLDQGMAFTQYSEDYWTTHQAELGYPEIKDRVVFDYFQAVGRVMRIKKYVTGGTFIDVGCSNGSLVLRASEQGFHAIGVEIDPNICKFAESISRCQVLKGPLRNAGIKEHSVDVITYFDVIEHVYDPIEELSYARTRLVPGGLLCFETFRTDGVPDILSMEDCKPAEHIYMYKEMHLRQMVNLAGFELLEVIYPLGKGNSRVVFFARRPAETVR